MINDVLSVAVCEQLEGIIKLTRSSGNIQSARELVWPYTSRSSDDSTSVCLNFIVRYSVSVVRLRRRRSRGTETGWRETAVVISSLLKSCSCSESFRLGMPTQVRPLGRVLFSLKQENL
jgi:hypothetical protein